MKRFLPKKPTTRLGDLLVAQKCIEQYQLEAALATQTRIPLPLGRILVELGLISPIKLQLVLLRQKLLRLFGKGRSDPQQPDKKLPEVIRARLDRYLKDAEMSDAEGRALIERAERACLGNHELARIIHTSDSK